MQTLQAQRVTQVLTTRLRGHARSARTRGLLNGNGRNGDTTNGLDSARLAGLRYVADSLKGIRRRRSGSGFRYLRPDGKPLRNPQEVARIRSLAIPPAWRDVWICPSRRGHLQATGRDAKARKQFLYHPRWRQVRDETKYDRLIAFAKALSRIRARAERALRHPGLTREKVLAAVIRLLDRTFIRVGNQEYVRQNGSFGLTTLRDRHVDVSGGTVQFIFPGKSGKKHTVTLEDKRLAKIVKRCRDLPGYELFQYLDEQGERRAIGSGDVNAYLREITGKDFTAKDFRTWGATVLAACTLQEYSPFETQKQAKRDVVRAVEAVADRLGNTKAICRKSYIHPGLFDAYMDGSLSDGLKRRATKPVTRQTTL